MKHLLLSTTSLNQSLEVANRQVVLQAYSGIFLFTGENHNLHDLAQSLVDRFALRSKIRVVVGGARFSTNRLPLLLSDQTQIYAVLDRVYVSRAETCYQMQHALQTAEASDTPLIIMDLLDSFYDENLTSLEVQSTLAECIFHLQRLSITAPVIVSALARRERPDLLKMLWQICDEVLVLNPTEQPSVTQSRLF